MPYGQSTSDKGLRKDGRWGPDVLGWLFAWFLSAYLIGLKNYNVLLNFETQYKSVQNNGEYRLVYMKFGSVYLVIGKEPTVYTIDH